ncbi:MAG: phosphonate C-P lyase system protein PhnG [Pseudomonadota bacterium]
MITETAEPAEGRAAWMAVLAQAAPEALAAHLAPCLDLLGGRPTVQWLRRPEIGAVMVRGRAGGTGAPFNLGEMTVTRASLSLPDGTVGHAWVPGRSAEHAENAALVDALMQGATSAPVVAEKILRPLEEAARTARTTRGQKAAATKVDFFTMVRGENA